MDVLSDPQGQLLFLFSEWLDAQGVMKPDCSKGVGVKTDRTIPDRRSHEELVEGFLESLKESEARRQEEREGHLISVGLGFYDSGPCNLRTDILWR